MSKTTIDSLYGSRFKKASIEDGFCDNSMSMLVSLLVGVRMKFVANKLDLTEENKARLIKWLNYSENVSQERTCPSPEDEKYPGCGGTGVYWMTNGKPGTCNACILGTQIRGKRGTMTILDAVGHKEFCDNRREQEAKEQARQNRFENDKPETTETKDASVDATGIGW